MAAHSLEKKPEIATKTIVRTKHKLRKFVRQSLYCVVKCIFVVVEREREILRLAAAFSRWWSARRRRTPF